MDIRAIPTCVGNMADAAIAAPSDAAQSPHA